MTEKRFTHYEDIQDDGQTICYGICDNKKHFVYNVIGKDVYDVSEKALIDLLNTLNDENEELKKEVKQLKNKIKTYNNTHELLKKTIDRLRSDG